MRPTVERSNAHAVSTGDHSWGVVPVLSNLMSGAGGTERTDLRLEVYGLSGIRELVRTMLKIGKSVRL